MPQTARRKKIRSALLKIACLVGALLNPLWAHSEEATPSDAPQAQWTDLDRKAMIEARVCMREKKYKAAIAFLMPLYVKAPYRIEKFLASEEPPPGHLALPPIPLEEDAAGLLAYAMLYSGQYPKAMALASACKFHAQRNPLSEADFVFSIAKKHIRGKPESFYSPAVAVNDLWIDFAPEPLLKDGSVLVPVQPLADVLHLKLIRKKAGKSFVLRREKPLQEWSFEVGKKEITVSSHEKLILKDAPFHYRDSTMISMYDVVTLLEGCFHWYPAVRVVHATFAVPK